MIPDPEMARAWQEQAKRRALSPRDAYAMAVAADRVRGPQSEVGYRLYWMSDELLGSQEIYARPSGYAVVGRHGSCDVVLDQDERVVSLRHVLVRAASLDDGYPVISVLDLQTSTGFELSDGSKQRSVAATGPIVFRIGTCSLVALPSSGRFPDQLPVPVVEAGDLAPHRVAAVRLPPAVAGVAPGAHVPAHPRSSDGSPASRITLLPHSVNLSQRPSAGPLARPADYVPTGEGYEVILESRTAPAAPMSAGVRLTMADLEHGVLIGRADKCVDEGLRSILGTTISRVHVLLIREKGACHLYDCASLVGTYANHQRVRCLPLDDGGTSVQLASSA
ncbi:MAG: hypothetical protein QOI41_5545, partial [Myxococcales bacterium]|nr:hypothetical protein [Myxococcales bacterium]